MVGWMILAALAALLVVLALRTLRFRPQPHTTASPVNEAVNAELAAHNLSALVQCRTESHPDASLDDAEQFALFEKRLAELYPLVYQQCKPEKVGARGLLFHWKGTVAEQPLLLTAHYDVVPAEDKAWSKPPFDGAIEDGMIWGRGTLDTKCTLVAALEAVEGLIQDGYTPERDVYLCFGGNEEVMGGGAPGIVDELERRGIRPLMVLDEGGAIVEKVFPGVSQPCALVGVAEKGSANYCLTVQGEGGHASAPLRNTPLDRLARACVRIHDQQFSFRVTKPASMLLNELARYSTLLYRMIFANLWLFMPVLRLVCRKGGEMNALLRTTIAFTQAQGSDAVNVLPRSASLKLNARILPGETKQSVLDALRRKARDARVDVELLNGSDPSDCSQTDTAGFAAIRKSVEETYQGVLVSPYLMIACSDARHYERICQQVYRFSGMPLSNEERRMIHGVDERIPVAKLADTVRFYRRLIRNVCGDPVGR